MQSHQVAIHFKAETDSFKFPSLVSNRILQGVGLNHTKFPANSGDGKTL